MQHRKMSAYFDIMYDATNPGLRHSGWTTQWPFFCIRDSPCKRLALHDPLPVCNFTTEMYRMHQFIFFWISNVQTCEITKKCEKGNQVPFMSVRLANISSKLPPNLSHHLTHSKGLFQIGMCSNIECKISVFYFFFFLSHTGFYTLVLSPELFTASSFLFVPIVHPSLGLFIHWQRPDFDTSFKRLFFTWKALECIGMPFITKLKELKKLAIVKKIIKKI